MNGRGEAGLHTHHNHNLEGNTGCGFASMRLSPQPSETFLAPSFLYNNNRLHGGPQTTNISSRSAGGRVSEFQEHSTLSRRSAHFEKHPLNTFKLGVGVSKQLMKASGPYQRHERSFSMVMMRRP